MSVLSLRLRPWLERARTEIARSVLALHVSMEFNIVAYDCGTRVWAQGLQPATPTNQQSAVNYLLGLVPTGATGTGPAVQQALANQAVETIVLITDGAPNCGASGAAGHRAMIANANAQSARIHVFGIDATGAYMQFLQDVAADSAGTLTPVP